MHAYDEVVPIPAAAAGARVITPYLRGFGPTRFLPADTMRSGQQAALGSDVIGLDGCLGHLRSAISSPVSIWGGLTSCVAAALWPDRVAGLVSYAGYDVIDVARLAHTFLPSLEHTMWYQHLFQIERGRECLRDYRRELCYPLAVAPMVAIRWQFS